MSILAGILLAVMLGFVVYTAICNYQGRPAKVFGHSVAKVITGSMEPSIHEGDYVIIKSIDADKLKVGDIITFYSEDSSIYGMLNTHRIVDIDENGDFITKGDANPYKDSATVKKENVIGIYSGKSRFLKWINSFASGKKLLMLLVIIPMLCVSVYEVITIRRINAESKEEGQLDPEKEKQRLIREAIDKEKQRLYDEKYIEKILEKEAGEVESRKNNEG